MRSRLLSVSTLGLMLLSLLGIGAAQAEPATRAAPAAAQKVFFTFYGWWDNTPPGGAIAYPQIHKTAGGKGTYADPITLATSKKELKPGTKVWVPRVKKYFVMEDDCSACNQEWDGQGPNGGPRLWHFDLWIGGKGGNAMNAIDCEDALTNYHPDGKPVMEDSIINPPSDLQVDPTPIFNTSTGECYGGAKPKTTVGEYKNTATGQCLENPGDSTKPGTALKVAACNGSTAQRFSFHGAFMEHNKLCTADSSGKVVLNKCDGGPRQQWSVNPNGTISDMQSNTKCYRASGGNVLAGKCSGNESKWAFKSAV
ncbi:ricin-type beta-trefoil lectin domain protein [Crossiella sp. CA-258035]|uniref:ricin-type beta-trefoil lectin domain protein n=1 Tax=Crossiella sp. CA-258035 TaxID=2981138 RepID=UPI0024BC2D30|nr:ricin-type beta-trefoil lectin domain protein [Crossiella sp. CA-258035]WHT20603.1 ricin-type beta-trefoil lectin domain protein [Crossiella sp. CA-258035]